MSKKFPDLKSEEEVDAWLQDADLTEYDLTDMKKVRFELARKDASISLRLPTALLASLRAEAAKANMPATTSPWCRATRPVPASLGMPGRNISWSMRRCVTGAAAAWTTISPTSNR